MPGRNPEEEKSKILFASLIMMLSSSAMQQLGKLVNPMTNKTEVNLEGAQVTIDLLTMLQEKTQGNLDKDEDKMLKDILSSLQMNYVETSQAQQAPSEAEKKPEAGEEKKDEKSDTEKNASSDSKDLETASGQAKKKDPKFHKSYGE